MENPNYAQKIASPIGDLWICASQKGITSICYEEPDEYMGKGNDLSQLAAEELGSYFQGTLKKFTVDLDWQDHSDFYQSVWTYLLDIPYGETRTYLDIARHIGKPKGSQAVGQANGKNPIPIIVPCHRVLGSNGSLTGFALGLDIKEQLLQLENPKQFARQGKLF